MPVLSGTMMKMMAVAMVPLYRTRSIGTGQQSSCCSGTADPREPWLSACLHLLSLLL